MLDRTHAPARATRIVGALAAVALVVAMSTAPAGAAPEDVSAPVTGSLTINGGESPFGADSVYFVGTFDPETGDLVGAFTFPPGQTANDLAVVDREVTQAGPGTGSVDLDTGEATFGATLVISLRQITIDALGVVDEPLDPCRYLGTLDLTGTFDEATGVLSLSDDGFQLAVHPDDPPDRCFDTTSPFAGIVNPALDAAVLGEDGAGLDNALVASFDVAVAQVPPPVEPPPPTEPPPAPPATPVDAQPTFAG